MKSAVTRWLLPVLVLCLLPVAESAGQETTASITGTVVDENADPLPGVNVVAVHQPTGTRYGVATGSNGRFQIRGMRVGGPYAVTASFVGYQTTRREEISLQLSETRRLEFQLRPQTAEMEELQVIGRQSGAVIDKNRTGAATNVSAEEIDELPTIGRSITDFTRLVPQAQGDGSLAGANSRYNSIKIDGATLDDAFGLGDAVPGSQAGAEPISLDAIQEFNIDISPYDVTSSGFTGGQVNAITKSGSNQFEGSFRFKGGTENFTGDDPDGIGTGEFNQAFYVGTFGGPIIEDELFFFVSAELKRESSPADTRVGANLEGENVFEEPTSTVNSIQDVLRGTYDYTSGGFAPLTQRQDNEKLLVKLDWNINDSHRLTLRNNYVDARDDSGIDRGDDNFTFSNSGYVFRSLQNSATATLNSTIADNMYNEARFVYTRIRDERDVQDAAFPEMSIAVGGERSLQAGIGRFNQANRLDQDLYEFTDNFTYELGDHSLTVGTSNKLFQFSNLFIQDFFGTYRFDSFETPAGDVVSVEQALRNGQPLPNPNISDGAAYRYSYATEAASSRRPEAEFSALQLGGYVQDEWQATDNLRLTAGLRVDVPIIPDDPTFNPTAFEAYGANTSDVASGNPLWSPRLGFNYDRAFLGDELSTQIRGGVGIFSGDPPYVWISNQFTNTGADVNRIVADDFSAIQYTQDPEACRNSNNQATDPACEYDPSRRFIPENINENPSEQPLPETAPFCQETPDSQRCSGLLEPVQTTEINLVSDDFKYPQTFRTTLAIDQELPLGFVTTLEGIYSSSLNNVTFRDLNLEQVDESKYGRPIYDGPVSNRFTNAIQLENTNKGYQYSLTGQLQRNVREGLGGSLSYTYSRAESVNNGSSSRAISNWTFNENKDVNDAGLGTADYEIRHRILGQLNYTINYADRFGTSFGLVYEGRSGEPFSWIYDGNANGDTGDGATANDLVYVPASESEIFLESDNWDLMNALIEGEEALDDARGSVIDRNTARTPWQHLLDFRLGQTIRTFEGQRIQFTLDVENVLNLLNDDWGQVENVSFNNVQAWGIDGYISEKDVGTEVIGRTVTQDDVGKPVVSFEEETVRENLNGEQFFVDNISSRWRLRLGVKYTF
ncbi:TonB-dependent receptor [Salinibacter altiplanensis]|uniref:TonB-dependent receptor n=1 Tax=Salinibacter altiplanensis TaxID=1803181 RepID=UPI001F1A56B2|nr:carboxypeptidase regulatory-like domain-containing protein [Salinibacter altiplanensis]